MEGKKARVLIVDDDPLITKLVFEHLTHKGYKCATANEAKSGFELFGDWKPNLCIIDFKMPNTYGSTLCEWIRKQPRGEMVPIIMISAVLKRGDRNTLMEESGADLFLEKPFSIWQLLEAVETGLTLR